MVEMRWIVWDESEQAPFDFARDTMGGGPRYQTVQKRKLQFRQKFDITARAGTWDSNSLAQTANYQWSEWQDVPEVIGRDPACP
jgi:hypothetical protein